MSQDKIISGANPRSSIHTLPTLPSGREIFYDHRRNSDFNEFDDETWESDYNNVENAPGGENEEDMEMVYIYRGYDDEGGDLPDEIAREDPDGDKDSEYKVNVEGNENSQSEPSQPKDDDENAEYEESVRLDDSNSEPSLPKSTRSRKSNKSNESIEIFQVPLANEEHNMSLNELLGSDNNHQDDGVSENNDGVSELLAEFTDGSTYKSKDGSEEYNQLAREFDPLNGEDGEWPLMEGEDHENGPHQGAKSKKMKKPLSPAKKRRRCILAISLLVFCLGSAGGAVWFIFDSLENKREPRHYEAVGGHVSDDGDIIQNETMLFDSDCATFTVEIHTDSFGNETSWMLIYLQGDSSNTQEVDVSYEKRYSTDVLKRKRLRQHATARSLQEEVKIGYGGPYIYHDINSTEGHYNSTFCLATGSYQFDIHDANGDGICCRYGDGFYSLYFPRGGRMIHFSTFEMGRLESTNFSVTYQDIQLSQMTYPPSISFNPSVSAAPSITSQLTNMTPHLSNEIKSITTASGPELYTDVSKSYGIMFDITKHSNIFSLVIVGFDLLVSVTDFIDYEVWTRQGSLRDNIDSNGTAPWNQFVMVSNGTFFGRGVCSDCGFTSIPIDDFQVVSVEESQSFWVTLSSDSLVFKNDALMESSYDSFTINGGSAVLAYPISIVDPVLDLSYGKGFLGTIHYQSIFQEGFEYYPPSNPLMPTSTVPPFNFIANNSSMPTINNHNFTFSPTSAPPTPMNSYNGTFGTTLIFNDTIYTNNTSYVNISLVTTGNQSAPDLATFVPNESPGFLQNESSVTSQDNDKIIIMANETDSTSVVGL